MHFSFVLGMISNLTLSFSHTYQFFEEQMTIILTEIMKDKQNKKSLFLFDV